MLEAGIQDGLSIHPVHIWPPKSGTAKQVRNAFWKGVTFIGVNDSKLTIHDLPPRTRIILHCNPQLRIAFSLQ